MVAAVLEAVAIPVVTEDMDHPWKDMQDLIATALQTGVTLVTEEAMVTGKSVSIVW